MLVLRYAYLLALVVWLGGMVVLGAIVAPALFQVLPIREPEAVDMRARRSPDASPSASAVSRLRARRARTR